MSRDHICPKCGAKESDKIFIGPFCIDCRPIKVRYNKKIELKKCKRCGKIFFKGGWVPETKERIDEKILRPVKGEFDEKEYKDGKINLYIKGRLAKQLPVDFRYIYVICPECLKKSGGYYEAIIQVRGEKLSDIKRMVRIVSRRLKRKTFIAKTEEKKEGIDLYVGSSKETFEAMKDLGIKPKITRKLHTQKQGKRIYRITFLIRV